MKLNYYSETDSLYIELSAAPSAETRSITDSLNLDLDADGGLVGVDIDHASTLLDLATLENSNLPLQAPRMP